MSGISWTTSRSPSPGSESSNSMTATGEFEFFNWEYAHTFSDQATPYYNHIIIPYSLDPSLPSSPDSGPTKNVAATNKPSKPLRWKVEPMKVISADPNSSHASNITFSTGSSTSSTYDLNFTVPYYSSSSHPASLDSKSSDSVDTVAATSSSSVPTLSFPKVHFAAPKVTHTLEQMAMFNVIEDSVTPFESLAVASWYREEDSFVESGLAAINRPVPTLTSLNWASLTIDEQSLEIANNNFGESNDLSRLNSDFKDAKDALKKTWTKVGEGFMEWWRKYMSGTQREALVLRAFFKTGNDLDFAGFRQFLIDLRIENFVKADGEGLVAIIGGLMNNNDEYALTTFITPTQKIVFDRWDQSTPRTSFAELKFLKLNCTVSRSIFAVQVCRTIIGLFEEVLEVGHEVLHKNPSSSSLQTTTPSGKVEIVLDVKEDAIKNKKKKNKKRGVSAREKHDARKKEKRAAIFRSKVLDDTIDPLYNGSSYSITGKQLCEGECQPFHVASDLDEGKGIIKPYNLTDPNMYAIVSVSALDFDRFVSYDSGAETEDHGEIIDDHDEGGEYPQMQPSVEFLTEDFQVVDHQENDEKNLVSNKDDVVNEIGQLDIGFDIAPGKNKEEDEEDTSDEINQSDTELHTSLEKQLAEDRVAEETSIAKKMKDYEERIRILEAVVGCQNKELQKEVERRISAEKGKEEAVELYGLRIESVKELFVEEMKRAESARESAEKDARNAREAQKDAEFKAQKAIEKESEAAIQIKFLTRQLRSLHEQHEAGVRDFEAERMGFEDNILNLIKNATAAQEEMDADAKILGDAYKIVRGLKDTLKHSMRRPHSGFLKMPLKTAELINSSVKELKQLLQLNRAIEWEQALTRKGKSDTLEAIEATFANTQTFVTNLVWEDSRFINKISANLEDRDNGIPEGVGFEEGVRRLLCRSSPGLGVGGA